ncbi:MAG TPA: hypothetical protein VLA72_20710 [Anaerolineales bacterium]|nr:hypothetical protein [Anaerolineales bacterium]
MLLQATMITSLFAMTATLWMGFYLFSRGFPSAMSLRVVVVMVALSGFFYGAYNNIFVQVPGSATVRAVLLVIVLGGWYSVTYHVMSERDQARFRLAEFGIYTLALLSIVFLVQPNSFLFEEGNILYVAHMNPAGWAYRVYGGYQFIVSFGIMLNLIGGDRVGLTPRGKSFLITSIFPVASVIYGVFSLGSPTPAPRIIQDTLAFCGVFVLGLSVARYQTWTERRATLQDFPLTTISTLGLAGLATFFVWKMGTPLESLASVAGFVVLAVGFYDLTREFLERQRMKKESEFRKQLRHLESENNGKAALKSHLQEGLELLCQHIDVQGGFVAIRQGDEFHVMASRSSVPVGSVMDESVVACEDLCQPESDQLPKIAWLAPSFEGHTQVAVVGIRRSGTRMDISTGNIELLAEAADQIGTIVSLSNIHLGQKNQLSTAIAESQKKTIEINSATNDLLDTISATPDVDFVKTVEEALRHLPDTITLGESPLAVMLSIDAQTHIERGKELQQILIDSIELLRPSDERPPEPLPRIWYNHAVLHDAYVEGVQNREIMARLYISEGTFNRTRRNAIRGLARLLVEKTQV